MLKNPVYIGKIFIPEWKKEAGIIVEGIHESIINTKTFNQVQVLFSGKQIPIVHKYNEIDEHLPLRGHLQRPQCNRALTGSASKGGNGVRHFYYHCNPPCRVRYKANEVNALFEKLIGEFVIKEEVKDLYKTILQDLFNSDNLDLDTRKNSLKRELGKLETRLNSVDDKFFDNVIDINPYNRVKQKTQVRLNDAKAELQNLNHVKRNFDSYLKSGITFLKGIDKIYKKAPVSLKKKIIGSIFPKKLIFENTTYRTDYMDDFISLILLRNKDLQFLKIEKPARNSGLSSKAPPQRLELWTL